MSKHLETHKIFSSPNSNSDEAKKTATPEQYKLILYFPAYYDIKLILHSTLIKEAQNISIIQNISDDYLKET